MARAEDRRTARTRSALRNAFIALLRRKHYDAITVQDIIDEADVGRSTFYSHCAGKEALVRHCVDMLEAELAHGQSQARQGAAARRDRLLTFSLPILEHVKGHGDLYPALGRGRGRDIFMSGLRQTAEKLVRSDLSALPADHAWPRDVTIQYVVGAFMSVLTWWLERNMKLAPADIDALFQSLAVNGIRPEAKRTSRGVASRSGSPGAN